MSRDTGAAGRRLFPAIFRQRLRIRRSCSNLQSSRTKAAAERPASSSQSEVKIPPTEIPSGGGSRSSPPASSASAAIVPPRAFSTIPPYQRYSFIYKQLPPRSCPGFTSKRCAAPFPPPFFPFRMGQEGTSLLSHAPRSVPREAPPRPGSLYFWAGPC